MLKKYQPILMKNTILHLRLPFSLFLMPFFWFALSQAQNLHWQTALIIFVLLHIFIYPASNAYNSYYDKDEGSIGGLENPPPVDKNLYYTAWAMDIIATVIAYFFVSPTFAGAIFIYGLISKAYSYDKIRLKKYPIISWLTVAIFQGGFVYLSVIQAVDNIIPSALFQQKHLLPALVSTLTLMGFYPMTQIYQHQEDAKRGDLTLSRMLGIRGTFLFTMTTFIISTLSLLYFFITLSPTTATQDMGLYFIFTFPVILFFLNWFYKTYKNAQEANFKNTMLLNLIGSLSLNGFFILLFLKKVL